MSQQLRIRQTASLISQPKKVKAVVRSLGLTGIGHERFYNDNNCIRGMVNKIKHLVEYEIVTGK